MEARQLIKRPLITEKTTQLMEQSKYCFLVDPKANKTQIKQAVEEIFKVKVKAVNTLINKLSSKSNVRSSREVFKKRMSRFGAQIRSLKSIEEALVQCSEDIINFYDNIELKSLAEIPEVFRNRDILITQYTFLSAQSEYIKRGGRSRGSYLINDDNGKLPIPGLSNVFKFSLDSGKLNDVVCEVNFVFNEDEPVCIFNWNKVRQIPEDDQWFENVWNAYRNGECFR
jgi:ribosomal protein L23